MKRGRTARDSARQQLFARLEELYETGEYEEAPAEAPHGPGRRGEAETAVRRALTDCGHRLRPARPRVREARAPPARVTGEEPRP
ncbi:hypothetical protein DKG34_22695 [Streptomyces sp. NWU49]|uniref:hypothetical protein n=1 Tax=Streptomyces sp. NWU49 TaxID=2201153 RepID=UPI000D67ADFE|nr:hypothetical protein [Streptomyces sp. NWU49]PWJ05553.1 hypothetical protein DKG34_22695 [Streptomyces sp. NWU49]